MKNDLRGEVGTCPLQTPDPLGCNLLADAVVSHLEVHTVTLTEALVLRSWKLPDQHILRLQIAIDKASGMQVVQSFSNLHSMWRLIMFLFLPIAVSWWRGGGGGGEVGLHGVVSGEV